MIGAPLTAMVAVWRTSTRRVESPLFSRITRVGLINTGHWSKAIPGPGSYRIAAPKNPAKPNV